MDNEKKIDNITPDEPAEPVAKETEPVTKETEPVDENTPVQEEQETDETAEKSAEPRDEVVIENFDDEKDSDDELYERYVEIMNQEEEEDDIAAVAERITGVRHSKVTTAAPLRIRENAAQTAPRATSMPVRSNAEQPRTEHPVHAASPHGMPNKKSKRTFSIVIAAALALMIVLSAVVVTVNVVTDRKTNPGVPDSQQGSEAVVPEETDEIVPGADETDEIVETEPPETVPEETEPEKEEETEPVVEPEPIVEPEPEPVPEFSVTLDFYDRDDITATVTQMTLAEVYTAVGYTPRESDRPSVGLDYIIAADAYITIDTAEYKNESVTETVAYGSEVIELDTIPRGEVNYINYGENGEVVRTYTVEYINGVETSRTLAHEETTKWPVNEKYELGVGGSFVGADGVTYTYSYRRTVPATYYSLEGLTYLGTMADESVIAVDPEKIPLGTKVYVKNDTYDFGVRIASDVGPKVEEWEVDVWLSPSNPQYYSFAQAGYHYDMEIYYID